MTYIFTPIVEGTPVHVVTPAKLWALQTNKNTINEPTISFAM